MSTNDEMSLLTHLYPEMYKTTIPPPLPQGGEGKRRRRKKEKAEGSKLLAKKRKLTQQQIDALELNFTHEHKLESERKERLAIELGLEPRQVAVWFQNRRARYKSQKLEDEFSKLKAQHDNVVAEKSQLQLEFLKLKEQIADAEIFSRRLIAERNAGVSFCGNSPSSSSFSVETVQDADTLIGNYVIGGGEDEYYVPVEYEDYNYGWVNLFDV